MSCLDTAPRLQLLQLAAQLQALADWEPVGARLEDLRMALAGAGGVTDRELQQLQALAARWQGLDPRLRALYGAQIGGRYARAVQVALGAVLGLRRRPGPPGPRVYGAMTDLWTEAHGYPPSIELIPTPLTTRRTT